MLYFLFLIFFVGSTWATPTFIIEPKIDATKPFNWVLKSRTDNEWCVENAGWAETHDAAWKAAHLFYIKHLCDFKSSEFNNRMKSRFGCNDEILGNWINYVKDIVCEDTYEDGRVSAEVEVEKWLQDIYASLSFVQSEAGSELVNSILSLTNEHCLCPEEIVSTVQLLYCVETTDNLHQKSIEGYLEITESFMKRFNISYI